jgi:hypothetical protein
MAPLQDWRLIHVAAVWTVVLFPLGIGLSEIYPTLSNDTWSSIAQRDRLELSLRIIVGIGVIPAIWFWFRMAADYLRRRPSKNPIVWGVVIFMGLIFGALLYFFAIWRPRARQEVRACAA